MTNETIICTAAPMNAYGVVLSVSADDGKPGACPGLGGWKRSPSGDWITTVQWPHAQRIQMARDMNPVANVLILEMEGDSLKSIEAI